MSLQNAQVGNRLACSWNAGWLIYGLLYILIWLSQKWQGVWEKGIWWFWSTFNKELYYRSMATGTNISHSLK